MIRNLIFSILLLSCSFACTSTSTPTPVATELPRNIVPASGITFTPTPNATSTDSPTPSETSTPVLTETVTALPTVPSLEARVKADLLSCRYGPGPEYLYLVAFRATAPVKLIGRVDAESWEWVLVENQVPCWVHADFLEVPGDIKRLPVVYPETARLPITPYYPPSAVYSAQRDPQTNQITVSWKEVPVNIGDYEDESMQTYIVEVWRCQDGELVFDPLATRFPFIRFVDEPGCREPSHGRVWVQEKHGYAGPADIPWPPHATP